MENVGLEIFAIGGEAGGSAHGQGTCLTHGRGSTEPKGLQSPWHPIHYTTGKTYTTRKVQRRKGHVLDYLVCQGRVQPQTRVLPPSQSISHPCSGKSVLSLGLGKKKGP